MHRLKIFPAIMLIVLLFPSPGVLEEAKNSKLIENSVIITSPAPKSNVRQKVVVKGKAYLPGGYPLWIVSRHEDFRPLWWPQREAEVNPATKQWESLAFLGGPQDIGSQFDIGAIVVNGEAHAKLRNYWVKAMRTGDWMPIELPKTVIAPKLIRVTKTGH